MSNSTHHLTSPDTTGNLWDWWRNLTEDQRDLLRIVATSVPFSPHVMDFLIWSECPAISFGEDGHAPVLREPGRFTAFVTHA